MVINYKKRFFFDVIFPQMKVYVEFDPLTNFQPFGYFRTLNFVKKKYISGIKFYLVSHNTVSKTGVNRCACVASIWSVVWTSGRNIFVHSVVQTILISINISIIKFQPLALVTLDLLGLAKFVSDSKVIVTGIASHSGTTVLTIFEFYSIAFSTKTFKSRSNCATTTFDCYNLDFWSVFQN